MSEENKNTSFNINEPAHISSLFSEDKDVHPYADEGEGLFTFIDLFAGIGGFRLGLQSIGGKCVYSSEWDKYAQKTYFANYGEMPYGDITLDETKEQIPEHFDILCAGFPCQPFSISGKQKGFEDTRGTLIYEVFKIISDRKPQVVLLENVKHLRYHGHGDTLKVILKNLRGLGYTVSWDILNASNFGVPQNRERIIITAVLKKSAFSFDHLKSFRQTISLMDFLDKEKYDHEYHG